MTSPDLDELYSDWLENKSLAFAGDLLSAAVFVPDKTLAREAARYVLESHANLGEEHPIVKLARSALSPIDQSLSVDLPLTQPASIAEHIRKLRTLLAEYPNNAVGWVDLSLLYASRGLAEKARRAMLTGLQLAQDNRFVLRSASRLFLHLGELDRAHDLLRRSALLKFDPWICSAEIAVATSLRKASRGIDAGLELLRRGRFSDHDTSELSSAVGVLDWVNGSVRHAKKHLRESLIAPNENSLAQARFMASDIGWGAQLPTGADEVVIPRPFEASAWRAFFSHDWELAAKQAECWSRDEIFSTRPVQLAAHIHASHLENYDKAIMLARQGRVANPNENGFHITAAFALASTHRTVEALEELAAIKGPLSEGVEVAKIANYGLIGFREHDLERGRANYLQAVEVAQTKENKSLAVSAMAYWAREEMLAGYNEYARVLLERAKELNKTVSSFESAIFIDKFTRLLEGQSATEDTEITAENRLVAETDPKKPNVVKLNWANKNKKK